MVETDPTCVTGVIPPTHNGTLEGDLQWNSSAARPLLSGDMDVDRSGGITLGEFQRWWGRSGFAIPEAVQVQRLSIRTLSGDIVLSVTEGVES